MRVPLFPAALALALALALGGAPALAAHNNPWAGPEDDVDARFHDDTRERSADTPGSDEMHGMENGATRGRDTVPGPGPGPGGRADRD